MKRILTGCWRLEANTFAPNKTTFRDYQNCTFDLGETSIENNTGVKLELGAFIDVFQNDPEFELIPSVDANTIPGGPMERDCFETILGAILEAYDRAAEEGPVDGILLALHGAMVLEDNADGEGEILRRIREKAGMEIPVIITLDFHANITEEMVKMTTAMFTYRLYPHTDMYEQGILAAEMMKRVLLEGARPTAAMLRVPLIYPHLPTSEEPLSTLIPLLREEEKDPAVYGVYFIAGFTRADIPINQSVLYAITENDSEKAKALCRKYAENVMAHLEDYMMHFKKPADAVREAIESPNLTVLVDAADNPGSGLAGDATELVHEVLRQHAANVAVATIYDPETVQQAMEAGLGATIHVRLGGKSSDKVGAPIEADAKVVHFSDGEVVLTGVMQHGMTRHCGPSCTLEFDGITVVVISKRNQTHDEEMFRYNGVEPTDFHILVLKSAIHYRAAYKLLTNQIDTLDMPNLTPLDDTKVPYRNVAHPVFPLDSAGTVRAFWKKSKGE